MTNCARRPRSSVTLTSAAVRLTDISLQYGKTRVSMTSRSTCPPDAWSA